MKLSFLVVAAFPTLVAGSGSLPQGAQPPQAAQQEGSKPAAFDQGHLEQLVAPIALYPDAILTQILMASTYPLEIVQADRWIDKNPDLKGTALEEALKTQDWDPSVEALCGFPSVLKQLSENLDWTRDLGDAFLGQKAELMDTVQAMRKKALDAGTLKTTEQQKIVQDQSTIVIEPASPEVVYVPAYSPMVVYGPGWYYPYWYYPYWYYPPPPGAGFVSFGVGFFWGSWFWGWGHCDWHNHAVVVDVVHFNEFHRATSSRPLPPAFVAASGQVQWQHDPAHRRGVNYRSSAIARSFGAAPGGMRVARDRARGFEPAPMKSAAGARPGTSPQPGTGARPTSPPPSAPRSDPVRPNERTAPPRTLPSRPPSYAGRGAFSGYRAPAFDHWASGRGAMSRRAPSMVERKPGRM